MTGTRTARFLNSLRGARMGQTLRGKAHSHFEVASGLGVPQTVYAPFGRTVKSNLELTIGLRYNLYNFVI